MSVSENNFIEVKDLVVEYTSDGDIVQAVNGVSFSLNRGETLGLVGETGAGKTTIAKSILRILPEPPARVKSGTVEMDGVDLLKLPEKEMLKIRGNKISMIFQDPMTALNPVMSVGKQITEVVALHNECSKEEARQRTIEMLEMVGIPAERYVEYPHQFSGGMKQRVVIAMALACNPELLLADEPTTALDVTIQAQVLDMIRELRDKFNTAMILITHDLGIVAETCDKVAVVYAGHIVESGTKEDIFKHVAHPYTQGLFNSIPKLNDSSPRLQPILGMPPNPTDLPKGCVFAPRCQYATDACREGVPENVEITPGHFCQCLRAKKEEV
ncbi:MAG: ABC transporter ATP-binding protein [Oscillospiraceae bacterium]|nr:ABC transporter ATP-binding protein [Oscillospiraceae bacterium]